MDDDGPLLWLDQFTDAYRDNPRDEALRLILPAEYSCSICGTRIQVDIEAVIREGFYPFCACWDNCPVLLGIFGANGPAMMAKQMARVGRTPARKSSPPSDHQIDEIPLPDGYMDQNTAERKRPQSLQPLA